MSSRSRRIPCTGTGLWTSRVFHDAPRIETVPEHPSPQTSAKRGRDPSTALPFASRAATSLRMTYPNWLLATTLQILILVSQVIPRVAHDRFLVGGIQLPPKPARRPHPQRSRLDHGLLWN